MSHFYAHADAGEPAVTINDYDPGQPFAVVSFGTTWDITTSDPGWCRRVAAAWNSAATSLEAARTAACPPGREASERKKARR
jgi:hypothetical protein